MNSSKALGQRKMMRSHDGAPDYNEIVPAGTNSMYLGTCWYIPVRSYEEKVIYNSRIFGKRDINYTIYGWIDRIFTLCVN